MTDFQKTRIFLENYFLKPREIFVDCSVFISYLKLLCFTRGTSFHTFDIFTLIKVSFQRYYLKIMNSFRFMIEWSSSYQSNDWSSHDHCKPRRSIHDPTKEAEIDAYNCTSNEKRVNQSLSTLACVITVYRTFKWNTCRMSGNIGQVSS